MVQVAERLRLRGNRSAQSQRGGTPTAKYVAEVPGITEARAGTYVFNDLMQLATGATEEEIALSILCTVVSRNDLHRLTVDGGSKTFSGDRPGGAQGGVIARAAGRKIFIERLSEEHGVARIEGDRASLAKRFSSFRTTCAHVSISAMNWWAIVETGWKLCGRWWQGDSKSR